MTKTCGECKHLNKELAFCHKCGAKWIKETDGVNCKYFEKITPPTNGDKIRQMSNEELAKLRVYHCPPVPAEFCKGTDTVKCVKCWLAWLNAPAESEGESE